MRIAVLTSACGWHWQDLRRAARGLDCTLLPVSWRHLMGIIGADAALHPTRPTATPMPRSHYGGSDKPSAAADLEPFGKDESILGADLVLRNVDRVLLRTIPTGTLEQIVFRMDVLQRLETLGVPVINPPRAMEAAVDKYLASARFAAAGLPIPPTAACEHRDEAMRVFEALGGDVVLKPLFGAEGKGISRINDADLAWRAFQLLEQQGAVIYIQRYIHHAGSDFRAFVLGARVLAAVRRRGQNSWRSNVSLGGQAEAVELTPEQQALAIKAARTVGARVAGVDLLPEMDGRCYVLEVNAIPGWKGLAEATGIDVARALLEFVQRRKP